MLTFMTMIKIQGTKKGPDKSGPFIMLFKKD